MRIQTNVPSLVAQQYRSRAVASLGTAIERLGSGMRINSAKDDAAGQAIGNRLSGQINGQAAAHRNANDGISLAVTAEGALSSINERLQRIRELTVQGVSGALNQRDRDTIQGEINTNLKEIDRLVGQSHFNGHHLLDGSAGKVGLQVGAFDRQQLEVDLSSVFNVEMLGLKDFYISGIAGDVYDIDTLGDRAINVRLDKPGTTVNYRTQSGGTLHPDTKLMSSAAGHYVQSVDSLGRVVHYAANQSAHSVTATQTSEVNVTAYTGTYLEERDSITGIRWEDADKTFVGASGDAFAPGANPVAIQNTESGHYYIRVTEDGEEFYFQASMSTTSEWIGVTRIDNVTMQADPTALRYTTTTYSEPLDEVLGFDLTGADALPAGAELVADADGNFYLRTPDGSGFVYQPVSVSTEEIDGEQALNITNIGTPRYQLDDEHLQLVNASSTVANVALTDIGALDITLPDAAVVADQNGAYYLRNLSGSSAQFHRAKIETVINSDGSVTSMNISDNGHARTLNDVGSVSGTSTVSFNATLPPNIEIRYVDYTGKVHHDVLGKDEYGNYILNIPEHGNGWARTATLVQVDNLEDHLISQDGDILVKTVNGGGDVIIYHAMDFYSITDVDDDYDTIIEIRETGGEIRLRQPRDPLAALDRAIAQIDSKRSELGAIQNRLESVISNLSNSNIQLSAARSRIMDTDYAVEVSNMTRAQILQQASTSVLAQANQIPQTVLLLLQ